MRTRTATDLGLDLDRFPARPRVLDVDWVLLQGPPGWIFEDHARRYLKMGPCPCCGGEIGRKFDQPARDPLDGGPVRRPGPGQLYCLGCDASTLDGRVSFPGMPIDYAPDPDYQAEATIYNPDPELVGGTAAVKKRVKLSKGIRRRKAG